MSEVLMETGGWSIVVSEFGALEIRQEGALVASSSEAVKSGLIRYHGDCDTRTVRWKVWSLAGYVEPLVSFDGEGVYQPLRPFATQGLVSVPAR